MSLTSRRLPWTPDLGDAHGVDVIRTPRLDLHVVRPQDYALLRVDRADPRLWVDRGFANPHRHLVDDPGPIPYRLPRVDAAPADAVWLLRMSVLGESAVIIGSVGFHAPPDVDGMVEIGVGVESVYRRRGLAQEMLHGMWRWALAQPGVRILRYTVSPSNVPSQAIIRKFGFAHLGVQIDEVDGPEDIFEMSREEYLDRWGTGPTPTSA